MVPRHHVEQTDHGDDSGVGGTEQKKEKNNADDPAKRLAEGRPETDAAKIFANEAQHIFAAEIECLANGVLAAPHMHAAIRVH